MLPTTRSVRILASSTFDAFRNIPVNLPKLCLLKKEISTSSGLNIREIKMSEETPDIKTGKRTLVVEGIVQNSSKERLVAPTYSKAKGCQNVSPNCHPLCRFNFVHEINHTDVLILMQFIDKAGNVIPRQVTGLCQRQHTRVTKLVKMAAKAGLFPEKQDMFREEKKKLPATRFNSYWDDSSIDVQHNEQRRKAKIRSFKK